VAINWYGQRIGFVNRAMRAAFCAWLRRYRVLGSVERFGGRPERPALFVRVQVRQMT
jgi:hypothetical protein